MPRYGSLYSFPRFQILSVRPSIGWRRSVLARAILLLAPLLTNAAGALAGPTLQITQPQGACDTVLTARQLEFEFDQQSSRGFVLITRTSAGPRIQIAAERLFLPGHDDPTREGTVLLNRLASVLERQRCVGHLRAHVAKQYFVPNSLFASADDLAMARAEEASEAIRKLADRAQTQAEKPVIGSPLVVTRRGRLNDWLDVVMTPARSGSRSQ